MADDSTVQGRVMVWWTLWSGILISLAIIYLVLGRGPLPANIAPEKSLTSLAALVPLFACIILRWLVLPRSSDVQAAFLMFVIGLTLAEMAGVLGTVFGGPYRDILFFLGMLGIAQFVPFFARRLVDPPPRRFTG